MFTRFARQLAAQGIAVLRYDFIGSGNSTGDFSEMTFTSELAQAQYILEQVQTWPWVNTIYLHGFSMGGALAAKLAANNHQNIAKLLLWSPAGTMPQLVENIIQTAPKLENGNYDCNGLELGQAFVQEMQTMDMYAMITTYQGPVQIIHGTNDQAIPVVATQQYQQQYQQKIAINHIDGADYTYSALSWLLQLFRISEEFLV